MSVHLYPQRIYWDGRAGCVRSEPYMREMKPAEIDACGALLATFLATLRREANHG